MSDPDSPAEIHAEIVKRTKQIERLRKKMVAGQFKSHGALLTLQKAERERQRLQRLIAPRLVIDNQSA